MSSNIKEDIEYLIRKELKFSYKNIENKIKGKYTKSEIEYILDSVFFIEEYLKKDINSSIDKSLEYLEEYN